MEQNFNMYSKNEIAKFDDLYYKISIYEYKNLKIQNKIQREIQRVKRH